MTTATLAGLVLIGGFVLLLLLRVPISFAMLLSMLGSAGDGNELLRAGSPDGGRREQLFAALDSVFYRDG